jgi:phospholipase/lecithinase/hemolysin
MSRKRKALALKSPLSRLSRVVGFALLLFAVTGSISSADAGNYAAIYTFGDSLSDTSHVEPATKYYEGRASNGLIWLDDLCAWEGVTLAQTNSFAHFADTTAEMLTAIARFDPGPDAASSLFVAWAGANDLIRNLDSNGSDEILWKAQLDAAVSNYGKALELLYEKGARRILVPNAIDLTLMPYFRPDTAPWYRPNTAESRSYLQTKVREFNSRLDGVLDHFAASKPDAVIMRADVFTSSNSIAAAPTTYGLSNVAVGASDDPSLDDKSFNGPGSDYMFWDAFHPTSKCHTLIAEQFRQVTHAPPAFANVSTRLAIASDDEALIGGFTISGPIAKKVVIRAVGIDLDKSGTSHAIPDAMLRIVDDRGVTMAANDEWRSGQEQEIVDMNLAPSSDHDAAIIITLPPGSYTAVAGAKENQVGVAVIEVYDMDGSGSSSTLQNISTRGLVGSGSGVMIGGFILRGNSVGNVVMRAIGPTLISYGITTPLLDPILELYNADGVAITANDDWRTGQQDEIERQGLAPANDREAAISVSLNPGRYTAVVRGAGDTTGVAVFEAYHVE